MEGETKEEECGHFAEVKGRRVWVDEEGDREVHIGDTEVYVTSAMVEDFCGYLVEFDEDGDIPA